MTQFHHYGASRRFLLWDPNNAPTDIVMSSTSVAENTPPGTVIAALTAIDDPDSSLGDTYTFTLIDNAGGRFATNGSNLVTGPVNLDYEAQSSWPITIRVTDLGELTFDKTVTMTVLNGREAPVAVNLSNTTIAEDTATGVDIALISGVDPDVGDTLTFAITADPDGKFTIVNNTHLQLKTAVNYEAKTAHALTIRATDSTGLVLDVAFTITVTNVNEAPIDITLSNNQVSGGAAVNTTIGTLSASDPDTGATFTYLITSDPDNQYKLSGNKLQVATPPDYAAATSHQVSIRATDQGGLSFSKTFTINVNPPLAVLIDHDSIAENAVSGSLVGNLYVTGGIAGETFTFAEVADPVNMFFVYGTGKVVMNSATADNYEVRTSAALTVSATGSLGTNVQSALTINILNVNEAPTGATLTPNNNIPENTAIGTTICTINATDPDVGDTFTFIETADPDNKFEIVGNQIRLANKVDWSVKTAHSFSYQIKDAGGLTKNMVTSFNVIRVFFPPTAIALSNNSVPENSANPTTVGTLSCTDVNQTNNGETGYTYAVTSDASGLFSCVGNLLKVNGTGLNFEVKTSYPITITVTDPVRGTFAQAFTVNVTNVNENPTDIGAVMQPVDTNSGVNSVVANLTAVDPDAGATFTYSVVSDPTGKMAITAINSTQSNLTLTGAIATAGTYSIGLRVTDQGGLTFDKTISVVVAQGSTYSAEANALFAKMTVQPTDTRKTLIDNLIVALKANGVWAKLDLLYVPAAANSQHAALNWKTPGSFTLTGSGTFTVDRGYTFDGTSQKYDTGFNPATTTGRLQSLNSATLGGYFLPTSTTAQTTIGNTNCQILTRISNAHTGRVHGATATTTGSLTGADKGFTIFARVDATNQTGKNTNSLKTVGPTTVAGASTSITSGNFFLGGGNGATVFSNTEIRLALFGMGIDSAAWASTYTAIFNYMNALGAQI